MHVQIPCYLWVRPTSKHCFLILLVEEFHLSLSRFTVEAGGDAWEILPLFLLLDNVMNVSGRI